MIKSTTGVKTWLNPLFTKAVRPLASLVPILVELNFAWVFLFSEKRYEDRKQGILQVNETVYAL